MPKVRCFLQKILLLVRHVNLHLICHETITLSYCVQKSLLFTCFTHPQLQHYRILLNQIYSTKTTSLFSFKIIVNF